MLKKLLPLLALSCMLISILVACGVGRASASNGNNASGTEVHMSSDNFIQTGITIRKGQSVTLIDDDAFTPHSIANGTWENGIAKPAREPNAPIVSTVQIDGSAQATLGPFPTAGTFKLYCTVHPGMNLTVIVQ